MHILTFTGIIDQKQVISNIAIYLGLRPFEDTSHGTSTRVYANYAPEKVEHLTISPKSLHI